MTNTYAQILPDSTGKKIQTFETTIGSDSVHAQAVVIVDPDRGNNHIDDNYGTSLFGQTLTAQPYSLADLVNRYYLDPLIWGTSLAGGGSVTHNQATCSTVLSVGATNADRARMRTHKYHHYQSGKQQTILITGFTSNAGQANQTRRWGYFDDNDGLFFEQTGTTLYVVRRTSTSGSVVDNTVAQSAWNGDKMDGTGFSGITLDPTKGNIYEIRLQWLGVGTVQFWINGYLVHTLANANTYSAPYMANPSLPVQVEVVNTGTAATGGFTQICCSVRSEGGGTPSQYAFGANSAADITVTTAERPIFSISPATTFQSMVNRIRSLPTSMTVTTEGKRASWRLVLGGTLTGASFGAVDSNSAMSVDVAATAISGGITLATGYLAATDAQDTRDISNLFDNISRDLRRNAFNTAGDILTVCGTCEAAGSTLMRACMSWKEIR